MLKLKFWKTTKTGKIIMKIMYRILWITASIGVALSQAGCTHREAAIVGAAVSRPIGYTLGIAGVAVDETFKTAGDIMQANPRHEENRFNTLGTDGRASSVYPPKLDNAIDKHIHYYKKEVMIKTSGPANIQSMEFTDSKEVSDFWRQ